MSKHPKKRKNEERARDLAEKYEKEMQGYVDQMVYDAIENRKKSGVDCFRDCDKVQVSRNGEIYTISADKVCICDLVKTYDGYKKVYFIYSPKYLCEPVPVIILKYKLNEIDLNAKEMSGELGLTPKHLIFDENGNLKQAKELKINDNIQTLKGNAIITHINYEKSTKIRTIVTTKGELMVNNIRVSSYAVLPIFAKTMHTLSYPLQFVANLNANSAQYSNMLCQFIMYVVDEIRYSDLDNLSKMIICVCIVFFCSIISLIL
eukprot:518928_1